MIEPRLRRPAMAVVISVFIEPKEPPVFASVSAKSPNVPRMLRTDFESRSSRSLNSSLTFRVARPVFSCPSVPSLLMSCILPTRPSSDSAMLAILSDISSVKVSVTLALSSAMVGGCLDVHSLDQPIGPHHVAMHFGQRLGEKDGWIDRIEFAQPVAVENQLIYRSGMKKFTSIQAPVVQSRGCIERMVDGGTPARCAII